MVAPSAGYDRGHSSGNDGSADVAMVVMALQQRVKVGP